ncbi:transcriptional regulator with XRE-family HTH domain [Streptomyces umbrinus]|uniref:Transcriptional regulator with XRE-family HTH domain n=2 Tax=Streptomyces umbrinus TaxID=67370 RepID=A0ABU0SXE9_9ACTN|nr:transcriptional regulator with XRE-family HTH domain [Streptomyces umbrinus]
MAGKNDPYGVNRDMRGDFRAEIREFLGTRRARVTPEQAGLPAYGGDRRRVTGLRREEVALLAGISSEYYTRLERGNATGVSESVIDGIAQALQLDEAERIHLLDLLRGAGPTRPPRRRPAQQRVRPAVQRVLDSMTGTPAFVLSGRLDVLAANALGRALFSPLYAALAAPVDSAAPADPARPPNNARFVFLDPHATEFFRDWDEVANDTVAMLRAEAGRDAYDRRLTDLIGELSTRSEEFRRRWAAHNVRIHTTGAKRLHHPIVGDLDLPFETFPLGADPTQFLLTYTAEPASRSQEALNLLASWSATTNDDIAGPEATDAPESAEPRD